MKLTSFEKKLSHFPLRIREIDIILLCVRVMVFNATSSIVLLWTTRLIQNKHHHHLMKTVTICQWYRGRQFYWCRNPEKNHRPVASHWQTLSYKVVLGTPRLRGARTHNISGDRHWLQRWNYHTTTTTPHLCI
jgi:hypothetical protein